MALSLITVFTPTETAKQSWASVGLQIVAGKLMTEIRQFFSRCARAPCARGWVHEGFRAQVCS